MDNPAVDAWAFQYLALGRATEHLADDLLAGLAAELGGELGEHKGVNIPNVNISLPAITEQEVAMHAQTFHQDEVRERIRTLFGN